MADFLPVEEDGKKMRRRGEEGVGWGFWRGGRRGMVGG